MYNMYTVYSLRHSRGIEGWKSTVYEAVFSTHVADLFLYCMAFRTTWGGTYSYIQLMGMLQIENPPFYSFEIFKTSPHLRLWDFKTPPFWCFEIFKTPFWELGTLGFSDPPLWNFETFKIPFLELSVFKTPFLNLSDFKDPYFLEWGKSYHHLWGKSYHRLQEKCYSSFKMFTLVFNFSSNIVGCATL